MASLERPREGRRTGARCVSAPASSSETRMIVANRATTQEPNAAVHTPGRGSDSSRTPEASARREVPARGLGSAPRSNTVMIYCYSDDLLRGLRAEWRKTNPTHLNNLLSIGC